MNQGTFACCWGEGNQRGTTTGNWNYLLKVKNALSAKQQSNV